jgi:hypothetical protein
MRFTCLALLTLFAAIAAPVVEARDWPSGFRDLQPQLEKYGSALTRLIDGPTRDRLKAVAPETVVVNAVVESYGFAIDCKNRIGRARDILKKNFAQLAGEVQSLESDCANVSKALKIYPTASALHVELAIQQFNVFNTQFEVLAGDDGALRLIKELSRRFSAHPYLKIAAQSGKNFLSVLQELEEIEQGLLKADDADVPTELLALRAPFAGFDIRAARHALAFDPESADKILKQKQEEITSKVAAREFYSGVRRRQEEAARNESNRCWTETHSYCVRWGYSPVDGTYQCQDYEFRDERHCR